LSVGRKSLRRGGPQGGPQGRAGDIVRGMMLLGRGSAAGLSLFGGSVDAFLAALAPQVAWQLVISLLLLSHAPSTINLTKILLLFCGVLVPPVLTHAIARRWDREGQWLRYATASLWCDWLSLFVFVGVLVGMIAFAAAHARPEALLVGIIAAPKLYDLWLRWFIARTGLEVGRWRALGLVLFVQIALLALDGAAFLLPPHYDALHDLVSSLREQGGRG
jgi:hypothetical protein